MDPNLQNSQENPNFKILSDSSSQLGFRRPVLIGKRSLAEFQEQQLHHQQFQHGNYLRNLKSRPYQQNSPISPLSPMEISAALILSSDLSSISNNSSALSVGPPRYGIPVIQQLRQKQNFSGSFNGRHNFSALPLPNLAAKTEVLGYESEKEMRNRLQELEKDLLDDIEDGVGAGDSASVVTNSEWSKTIQTLLTTAQAQKPISPSPTSSSSS